MRSGLPGALCRTGCGKPTWNGKVGEKCSRQCTGPSSGPSGGPVCVTPGCGKPAWQSKQGFKCSRRCGTEVQNADKEGAKCRCGKPTWNGKPGGKCSKRCDERPRAADDSWKRQQFQEQALEVAEIERRRQRDYAFDGDVTAALAWNNPSDLDLHAEMALADGRTETISYSNTKFAGGELDVDANAGEIIPEPVENIYWKSPPAGEYTIKVHLYTFRDAAGDEYNGDDIPSSAEVPFAAMLKLQGLPNGPLTKKSAAKRGEPVEVFRFKVDGNGIIKVTNPRM